MHNNITFRSYFTRIFILAILYIALPMFFSPWAVSTVSSYCMSVLCFFILTLCGVRLILKDSYYIRFYAITFLVQIAIGLLHYLYFVDPTYFSTNGSASTRFYHEYLSVFDALNRLQDERNIYGIFHYMSSSDFQVSHPEIWHLISLPFYFLQSKWMNFSALNVFSSLLASVNIVFIYNHKYKFNKKVHTSLLFWTAFFPIFLLNGTIWRDPFGVMLISIGLVLLVLSKSFLSKVFSFLFLGAASFMQRTIYLIFSGVATFWEYLQKTTSVVMKLVYFSLGIIAIFTLNDITQTVNGADYNSGYVNSLSVAALPIKILFGMIGPFPWTNFFSGVEVNPAFAWQLQDYIMGTFQFGYLLTIICKFRSLSFRDVDALTAMGFGIMLSGFISIQMHIGYISEGLFFTLPWFFTQVQGSYKKYTKRSLWILIALNIVVLSIGNLHISKLWR